MYKINIEYGYDDINNIFIKILNKEIRNYLKITCKNKEKN